MPEPLIRKIDHILVYSEEPEALCEALMRRGFPAIYPLQSFGEFQSAMFWAESAGIEVLSYPPRDDAPNAGPYVSRVIGAAFASTAPAAEALERELDARGVAHSEIQTMQVTNESGASAAVARNILLEGLLDRFQFFFTEQLNDSTGRRLEALRSEGAAPPRFAFLTMQTRQFDELSQVLDRLVEPRRSPGERVVALEEGQALRIQAGESNRVRGLFVRRNGSLENILSDPDIQPCFRRKF